MNTKLNLATAAALAVLGSNQVEAVVLAQWTFETSIPTTGGPHTAENGIFATTSFASSNTGGTFSNPQGNGSPESFSSNGWNANEYFQFTTGTTGYEDIDISFSQTGSNTGPRDFKLQYSVDGTSYTDFGSAITVPANFAPNAWGNLAVVSAAQFSFNLSSITALDNDSSIFFRIVNTSTTAINGTTVAAGGTSRVDTVTINGIAIIPEPNAAALLGSLGVLGLLRRRR